MAHAENAVGYAVEQVCGLYGVQWTREQSIRMNVSAGTDARGYRPIFIGQWRDDEGVVHRSGKPDYLARPRVRLECFFPRERRGERALQDRISVPLWIECKAKNVTGRMGRQTPDQAAFQTWVEKNGDSYLLLMEDVRPLLAWFDAHGVTKQCDDVALATVITPLDASELTALPCKWCGFARDQHRGKILSCPLELAGCATKLLGKVWSPDLRKGKSSPQRHSGTEEIE